MFAGKKDATAAPVKAKKPTAAPAKTSRKAAPEATGASAEKKAKSGLLTSTNPLGDIFASGRDTAPAPAPAPTAAKATATEGGAKVSKASAGKGGPSPSILGEVQNLLKLSPKKKEAAVAGAQPAVEAAAPKAKGMWPWAPKKAAAAGSATVVAQKPSASRAAPKATAVAAVSTVPEPPKRNDAAWVKLPRLTLPWVPPSAGGDVSTDDVKALKKVSNLLDKGLISQDEAAETFKELRRADLVSNTKAQETFDALRSKAEQRKIDIEGFTVFVGSTGAVVAAIFALKATGVTVEDIGTDAITLDMLSFVACAMASAGLSAGVVARSVSSVNSVTLEVCANIGSVANVGGSLAGNLVANTARAAANAGANVLKKATTFATSVITAPFRLTAYGLQSTASSIVDAGGDLANAVIGFPGWVARSAVQSVGRSIAFAADTPRRVTVESIEAIESDLSSKVEDIKAVPPKLREGVSATVKELGVGISYNAKIVGEGVKVTVKAAPIVATESAKFTADAASELATAMSQDAKDWAKSQWKELGDDVKRRREQRARARELNFQREEKKRRDEIRRLKEEEQRLIDAEVKAVEQVKSIVADIEEQAKQWAWEASDISVDQELAERKALQEEVESYAQQARERARERAAARKM